MDAWTPEDVEVALHLLRNIEQYAAVAAGLLLAGVGWVCYGALNRGRMRL